MTEQIKPKIGVSACLLGKRVRFDGGHKSQRFLTDVLSDEVEFVSVCPEVESGLSIPRPTLRQVRIGQDLHIIAPKTGADETERLTEYAHQKVASLKGLGLNGFILKKDSPSCGISRVKIYPNRPAVAPSKNGVGVFAEQLQKQIPALPLSEEGWLNDVPMRHSFLARVYTHRRMQTELVAQPSKATFMQFHADHKLLFMAHSPHEAKALGRLVAHGNGHGLESTLDEYAIAVNNILGARVTRAKHANVLQHMLGYFKKVLSAAEKREMVYIIDEFRNGLDTLAVPLTLLKHHLAKHQLSEWLARQIYFRPYPKYLAKPVEM